MFVPVAIVTMLALLTMSYTELVGLRTEIQQSVERAVQSTMVSEWVSGGISKTLTTTRQATESDASFAIRHKEELAEMLIVFPKDE